MGQMLHVIPTRPALPLGKSQKGGSFCSLTRARNQHQIIIRFTRSILTFI
ncbi:hypothetical protein CDL12_24978 [Handroanthus impetiginosus]|uniref:Uncharacterized protein n=1 Tax=Handroanthus impetiginosus TaxID=429701 RepID=A0A2G9GBB2_9LAMI|nr:hypothetical protein CDL12_24978 [Handroanthus impetiginosus]